MKSKTTLLSCLGVSFLLMAPAAMAGPSDDLAKMLGMMDSGLVLGDYVSPDGNVSYQGAAWKDGSLDLKNLSVNRGDLQIQAGDLQATNGFLDFHQVTLINTKGNLSTMKVDRLRSMGAQAYEFLDTLNDGICPAHAVESDAGASQSASSSISMQGVYVSAPKDPITARLKLPGTSAPEKISIASVEAAWRRAKDGDTNCLDIPSAELTGISLSDATGNRLDISSSSFSSQSRPMHGQDISASFSFGGVKATTAEGQSIWKLNSLSFSAHADAKTVKAFQDKEGVSGIKKALMSPEVIMSGGSGVSFSVSGLDIPNPMAAPEKTSISPRIAGKASFDLESAGLAVSLRSMLDMTGVAKANADVSFMLSDDAKAKAASAAFERMHPGAGILGRMSISGAKVNYMDQGLTEMLEDRTGQTVSDMTGKIRAKIAAKSSPDVANAIAGWIKVALSDPLGAHLSAQPDTPVEISDAAILMVMNPASLVDVFKISTK